MAPSDTPREGDAADQQQQQPPTTFSSTSTLLKEISVLRLRLQELESSDGCSSVATTTPEESPLVVMLRKDLAQVELEKATMEREFMNQLSSLTVEHQAKVAVIQDKLQKSEAVNQELNEKLIEATAKVDEGSNSYLRLLEEEREAHSAEIEKMKENLAHTDMEIAESRREMDNLEERLFEIENEKEALLDDNDKLRRQYERASKNEKATERTKSLEEAIKQKDSEIQTKREEVGEMNDAIIMLEEHKQMLVAENTDVRVQLAKAEEANVLLKSELEQMSKQEKSLAGLEERDEKIDRLSASLSQERRLNRELRDEIKVLREASSNVHNNNTSTGNLPKNHSAELSFLRNQNKVLNDEIRNLRRAGLSPIPRDNPQHGSKSLSSPALPTPPILSPPLVSRVASVHQPPASPKFSGIVAKFERRIANGGTTGAFPSETTARQHGATPHHEPMPTTPSESLLAEHTLELERELKAERETIHDLRQQLLVEKERVNQLRAQLSGDATSSYNQQELEPIRAQLKEAQQAKWKLENDLQRERALANQERVTHNMEREHLETHVADCQRRIDSIGKFQEEKKEDGSAEELSRLRTTVGALRPELESALEEIQRLETEVGDLKRRLRDTERSGKSSSDAEVRLLKEQVGKLEAERVKVEDSLHARIHDLENEIEVIEVAAEEELEQKEKEIDKLMDTLSQKEKEIARLEQERTQLCSSMNDVSLSRKDAIDELQAELVEMNSKTTAQSREIESLKERIQESNSCNEKVAKLTSRVKELEEELKVVNWTSRNQVHQGDIETLRKENTKLRDCIRDMKMERRSLQERLESIMSERSSSKSSQVLRERNASLKHEVEKLTKRLRKMEDSITRFAI